MNNDKSTPFYPVAGTQWSVAGYTNDGAMGAFDDTPWEFHEQAMNAGTAWFGGYAISEGTNNTINCEIMSPDSPQVADTFQVCFLVEDRFIAIKDGQLYRFGKRISVNKRHDRHQVMPNEH
jgi:hypothetical protein